MINHLTQYDNWINWDNHNDETKAMVKLIKWFLSTPCQGHMIGVKKNVTFNRYRKCHRVDAD